MKRDYLAYICILISGVLWGAIGITVRLLASFGLTATQIVVSRFISVSLFFASFIFFTDKGKFRMEKRDIKYFALFGLLCIFGYNIGLALTIQLTSLSIAVALLYTSPIWAMLLSIPIFCEKLTRRKVLAVFLSFTGVALISGLFSGNGLSLTPLGLLIGVLSGLGYGSFGVFAKKFLEKYDLFTTNLYPFVFASIGGLFICDAGGMAKTISEAPVALVYILVCALICYVIPYGLYTYSLNYVEASKAAVIVSIEPVCAAFFGLAFYDEKITPTIASGIFLILTAIYILNRSGKPPELSGEPPKAPND